jgi:uncharacterized membrane protein YagU involved in acid resistance
METRTHPSFEQALIVGVVSGLAGGLAMNLFTRLVSVATAKRGAESVATGRGVQPLEAAGPPDDDAAIRVGSAAYRAVTGRRPPRRVRPALGAAAHYALSVGLAVGYAWLGPRLPGVRAGRGAVFGSIVWAIADETVMPALGLSRGPRELTAGTHVQALAGHWVYGATVDGVQRVASR